MTELDLTPIKDRLARARHLPVFLTVGDIAKARENRKGLYRWHLDGTWDDAVLFGRARDDIASLIAEVERLRAQVNELACLWDAVTDAVGVDTDPPGGEWQTAFDAKIESYHGHGYESGKRDGRKENKRLSAQIDAAREMHYPVEIEPSDTICGGCSYQLPNGRYLGKVVEYPCPTIRALGGEQ